MFAIYFWLAVMLLSGSFWSEIRADEIRDGSEDYSITHWVTKDGLPQNTVTAIQQTADGYMWIGTFNGLVRFDGIHFTSYNIENTSALKSDYITYLKSFSDGALWIGASGGGLLKLQGNQFQNIHLGDGADNESIVSVLKIPGNDDSVFVLTRKAFFRIQNESVEVVVHPPTADGYFSNVGFSPEGELWIEVSNWDIYRVLENWNLEFIPQSDPAGKVKAHSKLGVGAFNKLESQLRYISFSNESDVSGVFYFSHVQFVESKDGVWFGGGGYSFTKQGEGSVSYTFDVEPFRSHPEVITLFVDDHDNVWVGMDGGGLARLSKKSMQTVSVRDGLPSNNTISAAIDKNGTIWTGHYGVQPGAFGFVLEGDITAEIGRWVGVPVSSFAESKKGWIWAGTMGMRIMKLKDNVMFHLSPAELISVGDPFQLVRGLYEDDEGGLWIGSENQGLKYWKDNQVFYFNTDNGLSHNRVQSIEPDREGFVWVGTGDGLNRISPDGEIEIFREDQGLGVNAIHCLYLTEDGVLCVGTAGGGLSILRPGSQSFVTLKERHGLPNGVVAQIIKDDLGFLWMGTNRGICRMAWNDVMKFANGETEFVTSMRFGIEDGMLNEECGGGFQSGCVKDSAGRLWFTTVGGLVKIDPLSVVLEKDPPNAYTESVIVDGRVALENLQASAHDQELNLYSGHENIEIRYTGIDFRSPDDVVFRYKLEGFDTDWVSAGRRRSAFYSQLPPGEFLFKLAAANDLSLYGASQSNIILVIHPAWWQRMDIRLGAGIGVFLIFWFSYRYQLNRLKAEKEFKADYAKRLILSQEKERQRISRELHDGLGQSLLAIKNRSGMALMESTEANSDGYGNHFNAISDLAGDALKEVRQISHDLRPLQIDRLGLKCSIEALAQQVAHSSDLILDLQVEDLDAFFSSDDQTNIWRIVQESLNNIVKHAHASEVGIQFIKKGNQAALEIQDDGRGIQVNRQSALSTGLGLRNIRERAEILEAHLEMDSKPGEGLTLRLIIPIQKIKT